MAAGAFDNVLQPFSEARVVVFSFCTIDGKLRQLSKWFPRIRVLAIHNVDTHLDYIKANSPNLDALCIMGRRQNDSTMPILNVLRLNPHLMYLYTLHIFCYPEDFLALGNNIINLRNVVHLRMEFVEFGLQPIPKIPISCQQLHEFSWGPPHRLDDSMIEFFKKHPCIIKLNIVHRYLSVIKNTEDIVHIARALPSLQEVNFRKIELSVEKVIPFLWMTICKYTMTICWTTNGNYRSMDSSLKLNVSNESVSEI